MTSTAVQWREFRRFFATGCVGFVVDAAILAVLVLEFGINPYAARAASFAMAVTCTWLINRFWSFAERRSARYGAEYLRYLAIQVIGAGINFGIYGMLIASGLRGPGYPVTQLAAGALIAMLFTYFAMRRYVFRS